MIIQGWVGKLPEYAETSQRSVVAYAEKLGVEYKFVNSLLPSSARNPYFVSLHTFRPDTKVVWMDMDVLVETDENIFDVPVPEGRLGLVREPDGPNVPWFKPHRQAAMMQIARRFRLPLVSGAYNTGVMIANRLSLDDWSKQYAKYCAKNRLVGGPERDQPYINFAYNTRIVEIDPKWNTLKDWNKDNYNILHYAGKNKDLEK